MFSPTHIYANITLVGFSGLDWHYLQGILGICRNFKYFGVSSNLFEVFIVKDAFTFK